jgi:exonuclease III
MSYTKNTLHTLKIVQFNCGHSNHIKTRPFFDSLNPKTQHIIALQEPHIFKETQSTYTPLGYTLAMGRDPTTRVAFLISQELRIAEWEWKNQGPFMASLVLSLAEKKVHILNVYRPGATTDRDKGTQLLHELRETLADQLVRRTSENDQETAEKPLILLGDFNLHHPSWGGDFTTADREADTLVEMINSFGLNLLLPRGEVT